MRTCSGNTYEVEEGGIRKCAKCDGLCPKGNIFGEIPVYLLKVKRFMPFTVHISALSLNSRTICYT